MKRRVEVQIEQQHFIVVFDQEKDTALVKERVLIHDGPRRQYHVDEIRWFDSPTMPPIKRHELYERVMKEARSKL